MKKQHCGHEFLQHDLDLDNENEHVWSLMLLVSPAWQFELALLQQLFDFSSFTVFQGSWMKLPLLNPWQA